MFVGEAVKLKRSGLSYNFVMYEIRPANPSDFENIKKVNTKAFADNIKWDEDIVETYASTPQGEKYYKSAIQSEDGCFFVCEEKWPINWLCKWAFDGYRL